MLKHCQLHIHSKCLQNLFGTSGRYDCLHLSYINRNRLHVVNLHIIIGLNNLVSGILFHHHVKESFKNTSHITKTKPGKYVK